MSCQIRQLCEKCELALSSHWCDGYPCDCEKPRVVEIRQSRRVFQRFGAWWEDSSHEKLKHHTVQELQKSALSCYICFLLLGRLNSDLQHNDEDTLVSGPVVSYLGIRETGRGLIIDFQDIRSDNLEDCIGQDLFHWRVVRSAEIGLQPFSGTITEKGAMLLALLTSLGQIIDAIQPVQTVLMDRVARCAAQIQAWIITCDSSHQNCQENREGNTTKADLPRRLLQLSFCDSAPKVVVVDTAGLESDTKYATLSHRWGGVEILKLLQKNEKSLGQDVPFQSLPQTFQEATSICLSLGLRYLWIDSLCIIQDLKTDWDHEAARMCNIYSNAWLGIAATFAIHGHDGLLSEESSLLPSVVEPSCTRKRLSTGKFVALDSYVWHSRIEQAPLNLRAWVVQERILSPRTVHFASDQMWWSCMGLHIACEATPTGEYYPQHSNAWTTTLRSGSSPGKPVNWSHAWDSLVKKYMLSQITYGSDRPMAVAGIAEAVAKAHSILPHDYLAGLWRGHLVSSLLWYTSNFRMPCLYVISHSRVTSTPTWSWLSVNAPLEMLVPLIRSYKLLAQLLDARTDPVAGPFGPVNGGHVTLKGPLLLLRRSTDPERYKKGEHELGALSFHTAHINNLVVDDEDLERIKTLKRLDEQYGLFDCWDWPEMGTEVYFACLDIDNEKAEEWNIVNGLLLARFDRPDGGGTGYSRMARLELQFNIGPSLQNYFKNYEQQYTIY